MFESDANNVVLTYGNRFHWNSIQMSSFDWRMSLKWTMEFNREHWLIHSFEPQHQLFHTV